MTRNSSGQAPPARPTFRETPERHRANAARLRALAERNPERAERLLSLAARSEEMARLIEAEPPSPAPTDARKS